MIKMNIRHYLGVRNASSAKQYTQQIEEKLINLIKEGMDVDSYARVFSKIELINNTCKEVLKLLTGLETYNQFEKDVYDVCNDKLADDNNNI